LAWLSKPKFNRRVSAPFCRGPLTPPISPTDHRRSRTVQARCQATLYNPSFPGRQFHQSSGRILEKSQRPKVKVLRVIFGLNHNAPTNFVAGPRPIPFGVLTLRPYSPKAECFKALAASLEMASTPTDLHSSFRAWTTRVSESCLLPTLSHLSVSPVPEDRLRFRYS